jgi:glycosyltransferase involved in cell wall biosynthesis
VTAAAEPASTPAAALPPVDVVIATHNRPEWVRQSIDGVWGQDYAGRINVMVVFDKSEPDRSLERASENRTVRVTTNERSPGLAGARNAGITATTSEFVAFCDDDDVWLPAKIRRQVAALTGSPALTSVTGIIVQYEGREVVRVPRAEDVTLEQLARNRVMEAHPSSVLVRRSGLEGGIGLVDEQIPGGYGEDFDWILRAAQAGEIAVVEDALVRVRWGSSQFSQKWQTIIDSIDYSLRKHAAFRDDPQALGRLYGRRAFALAALGHSREGLRAAGRTIRVSPREKRAYLAALVSLKLVSAERLMRIAHRRGHGI